jgi:4-hydroxy-tetrahydrodipicolinate synthase
MAYQQLKGTGVALVTPFLKNGSIDYPSLEKIVTHTVKGGVDFLVALGTTAETPTLTAQEKQELLAAIVRFANGQVPVVCGIGGNNTAEVLQQLKEYDLSGVDAIMSVTPYYNKPTQEGLYQHYKAIASATDKAIILYNVPGRTGCNLLPATAIRLANECSNIVAVKEASGNMAQCLELIQNKPDNLTVLSGDDDLTLAHMAIGMEGIISVAANCFTKDMTDIINLSIVGKFDKARKVFYRILPGINLLFADGNPAGVKCALAKMNLCDNYLRLPLVPVSDATAKNLTQYLKLV